MNEEHREFLPEIIHRLIPPGSKPLYVFFTGPASGGNTFVLQLMKDVYNRYGSDGGSDTACNAYMVCTTGGKAAVAVGARTIHGAFKYTRHHDGGLSDSDLNTSS